MSTVVREGDRVLRFTRTERVFHWAQAIPYSVLMASGGGLLAQRIAGLEVIEKETLIDVHRVTGCILPAALFLTVLGGNHSILFANLRRAARIRRADLAWLLSVPLGFVRHDVQPPPAGKFNAGQKLNLLVHAVLIPAFFVSGLLMWFEHGRLLPWFVHVTSFVLSAALVAGHLYMALINPSTRPSLTSVFSGRVDAAWAAEHHPLEYGPEAEPGS